MDGRVCEINCRCNKVGQFRLLNGITRLDYPKWRRETINRLDEVMVYNMGNGLTAHSPDEAMKKFFERDFQDIQTCSETPHSFKCIPDSYVYGPIGTKVVIDVSDGEKCSHGDLANLSGKKVENNLFNKLRNTCEKLDVKNIVLISGFHEQKLKKTGPGIQNDPQLEIDLLIICRDSKTIIQIESKTNFKNDKGKAFKQLEAGFNYFNSKIPFLAEHEWKYVKVAYYEQNWIPEKNCEKFKKYVLTPDTDIEDWLKMMIVSVASPTLESNDPTYIDILKFIFYQMYQHEDCITQDDLLKLTDKNIEVVSKPDKLLLFLNKVQFDLLNAKEDYKRVAFLSQFGTGKTTLLKEKARRLLTNGQKVAFVVFKDKLIKGDSLLFQSYKEEFKEFKDLAKFIQIPCAGTTVNEDLKEKIKDNPDFHFMMDEVPICRNALKSKTLNEISADPSLKDVFIWFACQSEHAPDQVLLKDFFICPDMPHPLRYAASLLKIIKLIKDKKGDTNFPSDEINPDVYFNRGPRALFFTLKRGTNLSCAVEQTVHILENEKARTLIKIDFHQQWILEELKKSQASKRLIVLEDLNDATEEILANLTYEKILVVSSKDNGLIRGFEFSIVVHFTQDIGGDQVEMIYSRCKSKLIIVCNEDLPKELVPDNLSCDFAKLIPVNDKLMPIAFEEAISKNDLEKVLREIGDKYRPLPVDATNKASQTGLMVACISGALEVVELFLNKGAKLDAVDFQDWEPIHHAAKKGCLEVMKTVTAETVKKFGSEDCERCLTMKTNEGETALHIASLNGHLTVVQHLVAKEVFNVDEKTIGGQTPLHLASKFVHFDVVKYLVKECQADVNVKNNGGQTSLHFASQFGRLDVVKYLVEECQADANFKDNFGETPLHLASLHGHFDVVKYLGKECQAGINVKNDIGWTPLHLASSNGHLDVVKYLVEKCQADINVNDDGNMKKNDGVTPLHLASEKGHFDLVKYLVEECQADVNVKRNEGETPLHYASLHGHLDVVKYLVEKCGAVVNVMDNVRETPLHLAFLHGHLNVVKCLVNECQANVNMKSNDGENPLHWASLEGHLDVVKCLVEECQADVNVKRKEGESPLLCALLHGHLDVVKYLVEECQADVNVNDNHGWTPLHWASYKGYLDVVKCLVNECQADVNVENNFSWTPLHLASQIGHLDVVKYLVEECQPDVNVKDNNERTPLHRASSFGHLDVVKYLVEECRADVNVKNNDGWTPLHFASEGGHLDVVKYLVEECQADVNVKDNRGLTPLHLASSFGHFDVVKYLVEECQADVNVKDNRGRKPVYFARKPEIESFLESLSEN